MRLGNFYLFCFFGDDYVWKCLEIIILWYVKILSIICFLGYVMLVKLIIKDNVDSIEFYVF